MKEDNLLSITIDVENEKLHSDFIPNDIINSLVHCEYIIEKISKKFSSNVPVTWFIRCDDNVAKTFGKPEGFLEIIKKFISRRIKKGDLFGLHLHFEIERNNVWIKEVRKNYQLNILERSANGWKSFFGSYPKYSRMGEAFMNNSIAKYLDNMEFI